MNMQTNSIAMLKNILSKIMDLSSIPVDENDLLGEGGLGLDSLMFLKLLTEVEKEFKITIDDDYWDYKRLNTLHKIDVYIDEIQRS